MQTNRYIVHADMDAFFAAIEQRDNPMLTGKPVIVGADPKAGRGRGVVSTCSYEARKFGIHSAMPISIAYRRCPQAVFLPVDMQKYTIISEQIYALFNTFTPTIEPVSIDEAFLDITGSFHLFGTPFDTCKLIKEKIKEETGLTASLGLAPTKMAAKIASEVSKPDGLLEVKKEKLLDFLWPLPVDKIWGLGKKAKELLSSIAINTIGDLAKKDVRELTALFGKNGDYFRQLAHGIDEREVTCLREEKSISNEITFAKDTRDAQKIENALLRLSEKVASRLRLGNFKARTITLKIRSSGFITRTKAITLSEAINFDDVIYRTSKRLLYSFDMQGKKVRLVGVKAGNFICADIQDSIFNAEREIKKKNVYKAIDAIREKFGTKSIQRASLCTE